MVNGTVITDASFCPSTKIGTWAAWVVVSTKKVRRVKLCRVFKQNPKNSSEAEIWALANGLSIAVKLRCDTILLQSDSMEAVLLFKDRKKLLTYFPNLPSHVKITTNHIKGHSTNDDKKSFVNRWCDTEARSKLRKERKLRQDS
jgi:ribonuclease HI